MRKNDNIIFIDHKGVSHNMRVESFRQQHDGEQKLVHHEPLVTGNYNAPPTGEPQTLIDIPHISHPSRQENNPDLPSYPLHAWKYEDEGHLEVPADHPVHDNFNEQPTRDDQGNVIPKRRPLHEAHIAAHRAYRASRETIDPSMMTNRMVAEHLASKAPSVGIEGANLSKSATLASYAEIGHPANPDTVHYPFECVSCGKKVTRVSSHQGGKQWENVTLTLQNASHDFFSGDKEWQEHVCSPEEARAHSHKISAPKTTEEKPDTAEVAAVEEKKEEKLPVISVIYTSPDVKTYKGVKLVLPDGYEHIVSSNGFAQDFEDAIRFAQVQGFKTHEESPTVSWFRADLAAAEAKTEPDVIAELQNAPPAPKESETPPPADVG